MLCRLGFFWIPWDSGHWIPNPLTDGELPLWASGLRRGLPILHLLSCQCGSTRGRTSTDDWSELFSFWCKRHKTIQKRTKLAAGSHCKLFMFLCVVNKVLCITYHCVPFTHSGVQSLLITSPCKPSVHSPVRWVTFTLIYRLLGYKVPQGSSWLAC